MPIKKKKPNWFYIFGIKIEKFILIDFDRMKVYALLDMNKVNCRKRNNQKEKNF